MKTIDGDLENIVEQISHSTRRGFIARVSALSAGIALTKGLQATGLPTEDKFYAEPGTERVNMTINGKSTTVQVDPRTSLLDTLREELHLTGTKKGCDRGQCGACTVLVDGRRINSCLMLTGMCDGTEVVTIEGLAKGDNLHPMQTAFLKHDAFQCGYCTPGQICSAIGLIKEGHAKTDDEIRELMSGNICRCGAYQNILEAIKEVSNAL